MRLKRFCAAALLGFLLAYACSARADTPLFSVEALPLAKHYGDTGQFAFNKLLDGVAILVPLNRSGDLEIAALHYTNSFYIPTNVIGLSWMPLRIGPLRIGAMAGVSNRDAYPYSPVKPFIGAAEVNVVLGPRTQLNFDIMPCGGGAWCKVAVAAGLRQGIGKR